jgi:hypothetical protein
MRTENVVIPPQVLELLLKTPFGHFFVIEKTMTIERNVVREILDSYDIDNNTFTILGCTFSVYSDEVALTLGLPSVGKSFVL